MFRPPTEGYEEQPIDEAVIEFLQPRPTVRAIVANCDLTVGAIKTGDVIMVEPTSNIVDKAIVLLSLQPSFKFIAFNIPNLITR
ncbi:hypothetical protein ACEI25_004301 [Photobacterium damselae]